MDLRIVIVSWNVRDRLRECLQSIAETTPLRPDASGLREDAARGSAFSCETVVVDNASSDGTVTMVREEFPWVQVIENDANVGFAAACNQGIRESPRDSQFQISPPEADAPHAENLSAKGGCASGTKSQIFDFILLLNPDMRVLPGTLDCIVAFLRDPRNARVGVTGCHLVDEYGKTVPHVRRFPELSDQLAITLKLPHLAPHLLQNQWTAVHAICNIFGRRLARQVDRYLMHDFDYSREARVDSIRGSFFCIRRECLEEIGLLDEDFFIWFEEVDFCKRARDAGWEVAYTPSVRCVDYVGRSFARVATARKQRMFTRSMLTYFWKHHARWKWMVLAAVRPVVVGAAMLRDRVGAGQRPRPRKRKASSLGHPPL